ncbi:3-phosphoshikimate 1-carboxyvinyltransferase [Opitutus sp. ER46]|uniref:3-phosphoshikimate 1-carboxyvinyltransferase n=1 Tax=Opitutus sp. ER46 TaxID=2161864 RepID=UPI000D31EFE0|nr:3-phosphoshikimate 1-carboxyvinyltransferase [Opitutus sp. ER46]PTY01229.1 3-phosphoshikimate 1-carboxyvinyltransferase [Opitutus sp. ER46]
MPLPELLPIPPFTQPARGEVTLPGSKSLTNRALLLAALCREPVTLTGALFSEDTHLMAEALRRLGFDVAADAAKHTVTVGGQSRAFAGKTVALFVGLAGTAARFLTALCATAPAGVYLIDGVAQMRKRPMRPLLEALRALGADIRCLGEEGFFPIEIRARGLRGGRVTLDASESSQLLSALLMVAPRAAQPLEIQLIGGVRWPFVRMTTRLMEHFGQPAVEPVAEDTLRVAAGRPYTLASGRYAVEPDATAASYFLALPLATGGTLRVADLRGPGEGLQGDTAFATVLQQIGLSVTPLAEGGLKVALPRGTPPQGVTQDFSGFSDTFLTLAALAPLLRGPTRITGIAHTRKQETDRVAGMARELTRLGQKVIETEDSLEIHPQPLRPGETIETYGDHRFAMSFGILGSHDLRGDGQPWLTIRHPECCAKTFPHFFELLGTVREKSSRAMPSSPFLIVAIDGGAASGKSSSSRALADRFNLLHVDTGSFYRAITAELLRRHVSASDLPAVKAALGDLKLTTRLNGRSAQMEIGGRVAGDEIRSREVNDHVSHFAAIPEVRTALLAYQRGQADVGRIHGFRGLVMEGRDIGSVIFPEADFRFFLHADPAERARRRANEGHQDSITERDRIDSGRKTAPLACPQGATSIDTTHVSLPQVVELMAEQIARRLP